MTNEQIEKLLQKKTSSTDVFQINFKARNSIKGLFIKTSDYTELSRKNFWRIVSETHIVAYNKSKDEKLSRIFNGAEITRLALTEA